LRKKDGELIVASFELCNRGCAVRRRMNFDLYTLSPNRPKKHTEADRGGAEIFPKKTQKKFNLIKKNLQKICKFFPRTKRAHTAKNRAPRTMRNADKNGNKKNKNKKYSAI